MNDRLDNAIRATTAEIVSAAPLPPSNPVSAATQRNKIPYWVLPTLVLLPVFGFMYIRALTGGAASSPGPLTDGAALYSKCASCHGAAGGGVQGQGYQFSDGEVLATFPRIEDHIRFVHYGTDQYRLAGVAIYGDPARVGGPHITGERGAMPPFRDELTTAEIIAVVCHERYTLSGADPSSDDYVEEYNTWCSPDAVLYSALNNGELDLVDNQSTEIQIDGTDITVTPIGPSPIDGSSRE
ncbi:c-type cytochrome [Ilumatobacter sp.]|uniref:c-type cytochrome n=1 Tax=Ilumatobacter sp. TaxID=1967498 RepID=UPI0037516185